MFASANATVFGSGLEVLWCPSDPSIRMEVQYSLYEEPFTEKRVTGNEEIVVRKEVVERPETVRGTVRETKVEIDDGRGTATTPNNPSTTPPRR